jgi:hypothetical protein
VSSQDAEPPPCDLCGLPVEGPPCTLRTPEGRKVFCCDGCKGIYQILHGLDEAPEDDAE